MGGLAAFEDAVQEMGGPEAFDDVVKHIIRAIIAGREAERGGPRDCKVCFNIEGPCIPEVGKILLSANTTFCLGCTFLACLLFDVFGGELDPKKAVCLFPPLAGGQYFLAIPDGSVFGGWLEVPNSLGQRDRNDFGNQGLVDVYSHPGMGSQEYIGQD